MRGTKYREARAVSLESSPSQGSGRRRAKVMEVVRSWGNEVPWKPGKGVFSLVVLGSSSSAVGSSERLR